jgi:hypothetical protein
MLPGGAVAPADNKLEPITATDAAKRLERAPSTVRCWAFRFNARKLGERDGKVYYDYLDLMVIEREIYHGHPVPATWQERAEIRKRCPLKAPSAASTAA